MTIERVSVENIKPNPNNPRFIRDDNIKKLVKSIKEFPEMLEIRPIVIDNEGFILGGNMRLKACKEAGLKEVPIIKADNLTEEQKKEFILKDNQSFGEWDTKLLNDWDKELLLNSGFEQHDLIDIWGTNEMVEGLTKELEGSNFNKDLVDVDDYIKQNILFLNEYMIEFIDDDVKKSIRSISKGNSKEAFEDELKQLIKKYG